MFEDIEDDWMILLIVSKLIKLYLKYDQDDPGILLNLQAIQIRSLSKCSAICTPKLQAMVSTVTVLGISR